MQNKKGRGGSLRLPPLFASPSPAVSLGCEPIRRIRFFDEAALAQKMCLNETAYPSVVSPREFVFVV